MRREISAESGSSRPAGVIRAETERSQRTRARLIRGGLFGLLLVLLFCAVAGWQREARSVRALETTIQQNFIAPLQQEIDRWGAMPLAHPLTDATGRYRGPLSYLDPESVRVLRRAKGPVIVGVRGPVRLLFHRDGFYVAVCENGKVRLEWLTPGEYEKRVLPQAERVECVLKGVDLASPSVP